MKKSCKYCGGSHDIGATCPTKAVGGTRSYIINDVWVTVKKGCHDIKNFDKSNKTNPETKVNSELEADIIKFRNSNQWKKKTKQIKERDLYMCRICAAGLFKYKNAIYNNKNIEVHHIKKLRDDFEKRLDDDNLICLCAYHHKLADSGKIDPQTLNELIEVTTE